MLGIWKTPCNFLKSPLYCLKEHWVHMTYVSQRNKFQPWRSINPDSIIQGSDWRIDSVGQSTLFARNER